MGEESSEVCVLGSLSPVGLIPTGRVDRNTIGATKGDDCLHARPVMNAGLCRPLMLSEVQVESDFQFISGGSESGNQGCSNVGWKKGEEDMEEIV
ncbi:hypothetical protein Q3G72_016541 [Acer saccharum]|nr:hypothetical protein Q3G72_016541 [Acer saccharum]